MPKNKSHCENALIVMLPGTLQSNIDAEWAEVFRAFSACHKI